MTTSDVLTGARTMWELVDRRAQLSPDHPLLIAADGETLTFGQFRDRAERVAAGLSGMGIRTGSVVSWQLPTRIDTVVLSIALARLGAVQNPIIHLYREREVGFALRQTGAELFVIPATWRNTDFRAIAEGALAGADTRAHHPDDRRGPARGRPGRAAAAAGGNGARGRPDPLDLLHVRIDRRPQGCAAHRPDAHRRRLGSRPCPRHGSRRRGLDRLPVRPHRRPRLSGHHAVHGFPGHPRGGLLGSRRAPGLPPARRHHGRGEHRLLRGLPRRATQDPGEPILPSLRLMSGGGAAKPPEVHYEVRDEIGGRGVVHGYGMTEVPMIANGSPHDTDEQLANTDGKPVEGADVRIVTLDGRLAAPDEEGEVRVKGPMVFHGYTDPALDAEAFDEEGYFRTGDLGRLRADGHLNLTGRLKDVIVRKGENISAKEIEDLLYTHPDVVEVAVIGLPDPERGERVCAVVQLAEGSGGLELADVVSFCREAGLMTQKIPEQLQLRTDWPRAGTGKIVKKALRDEYAAQ